MTHARQGLGKAGEEIAARHLEAIGYEILERNVRFRVGEIDIVARDHETLVFIEVRARRTQRWGSALESVGPAKQRKLIQLARYYLASRKVRDHTCRFDVVGVTWEGAQGVGPRIDHVTGAFDLS